MKAITCSQCGALNKDISLKMEFAKCEYCLAAIPLKALKDKVFEIPDKVADEIKTLSNWELYLKNREENRKRYARNLSYENPEVYTEDSYKVIIPFLVIAAVIGVALLMYYTVKDDQKSAPENELSDFKVTSELFYPSDLHTEKTSYPLFSRSEISEREFEELRTLPSRKRSVEVKVTINKKGQVTAAEAQSDNEILRVKSEKAARDTTFYPIDKAREVTIIYNYYY